MNKIQIIILYHKNQLQTYKTQFQIYIDLFLDKYTYKYIVLYIVNLSFLVHKDIIMFNLSSFNN